MEKQTAEELWKDRQQSVKDWLNLSNYERWKRERKLKKESRNRMKLLEFTNSRKRV